MSERAKTKKTAPCRMGAVVSGRNVHTFLGVVPERRHVVTDVASSSISYHNMT